MSRRLGAILALGGGGVALAVGLHAFITDFPGGLVVLACVLAALAAAWLGLLRHGPLRLVGICVAALLVGAAIGVMAAGHNVASLGIALGAFLVAVLGARAAFRAE
ncbi:MAG: hypothetical protein ACM3NV_10710, partial [Syntrophothermus sp.]